MIKHQARPGISEFWLLAGISVLVIGVLALVLWQPWSGPTIASSRPLVFYCAAGMAKPVQDIIAIYEQKYEVQVQANFGGSGQLLSTIRATGTGDLFLSADQFNIDKARKEGLVAEAIPVAFLEPVLIVNAATQERLKEQSKPVTGLNDLLRPELRVVLANPELAAIGKMVKDALSDPKIGLWPKLDKELKQSSNRVSTVGTVHEVATVVRTSENTLGLVWRATAKQTQGVVIVESDDLKKLKEVIQIGILTSAKDEQATAALQFARFLTARDQGLTHFAKYHLDVVLDADVWAEKPRLHLSAGAMLKPAIDDVVKAFAQREGVTIDTSYAGCGLLVSQMKAIKQGEKPGHFPDAYFSCDVSFLDMDVLGEIKVKDWFDAAKLISANDMVLVVQKGNPKKILALKDLTSAGLKVGLGHPKNSALGKLTRDLLDTIGLGTLYDTEANEKSQVVFADAGHDLVNKIRLGALDVALVYRSNALSNPDNLPNHMDIITINQPGAMAHQPFAIARDSQHKYLMKRLLQAIVASQTADRFKELGFHWVYDGK
jgi:molybdenum ABC transporter molybdate-binding protein